VVQLLIRRPFRKRPPSWRNRSKTDRKPEPPLEEPREKLAIFVTHDVPNFTLGEAIAGHPCYAWLEKPKVWSPLL
jgi:hypothetical protein